VKKYASPAPCLSEWLEHIVPAGLTGLALPPDQRRQLETTNGLERLNKEIKRRTRVATLFPGEPLLLRLVSAALMEISEEWENRKSLPSNGNECLTVLKLTEDNVALSPLKAARE